MKPTWATTSAAGLLACLLCVGCGGEDWQAETYPATGRITVNGQPPVGAVVQLHAAGEKVDTRNSRPWGIVQDDGSYTLSTYEKGDGAPAGEYILTITWPWDVTTPSLEDRLNYAYSSPEKSQWRLTVSEGDNELPLVEITGIEVAQKPGAGGSPAPPMPGMPGKSPQR